MAAPVSAGLTWSDLAPAMGLVSTMFLALVGAVWTMHQREIRALHDHIDRVAADLDTFRHQEIKAIQDAINVRMDKLGEQLTEWRVDLARNYMPRQEVESLIKRLP